MRFSLAAVLLIALQAFVLWNRDTEFELTSHHALDTSIYGGYANFAAFGERSGVLKIQVEARPNLVNVYRLDSRALKPGYSTDDNAARDRLFTPFWVAVLGKLSFGLISIAMLFKLANLLLWIGATGLTYALARHWFPTDPRAASIASILTATLPMFGMMLGSYKIQYLGTVWMLAAIALFEMRFARWQMSQKFAFGLALGLSGPYASGGLIFVGFYLIAKGLLTPRSGKSIPAIATTVIGTSIGVAAMSYVSRINGFRSASEILGVGAILSDTARYFFNLFTFQSTDGLRLLGFVRPIEFWRDTLPLLARSHLATSPIVLPWAIVAAWKFREARLAFWAGIALIGAHVAEFFTGWVWVYGYLTAPSLLLLTLAAARALSDSLQARRSITRFAAVASLALGLLISATDWHPGVHFQLNQYYGALEVFPLLKRYYAFYQ